VRYESALKVVRSLKEAMGQPLSIRAICRRIALSYQPTHKHVRALEAEGVLRTEKRGREVLCELAYTPATTLWLGLVSVAERRELSAQGGAIGEFAERMVSESRAADAGVLAVVVRRGRDSADGVASLVLVTRDGGREAARAVRAAAPNELKATVYEASAFAQLMSRPFERNPLLAESVVLSGEQAYWRLAFAQEPVSAEGPPAEPYRRPPRRARKPKRPRRERPAEQPAPARPRATDDDVLFVD
jgi:hypothetical protein